MEKRTEYAKIEHLLYDARETLPRTDLEWRVSDMREKKKTTWKYAVAVASVAVVFWMSNTICFAMTGNSILDEVRQFWDLDKEDIRVNNHEFSDELVNTYVGEDGMTYYEFSDGSKTGVRIDNPAHTSVFEYRTPIEGGTAGGVVWFEGTLYKEADRIYLDLYGAPVDVTEDFADGMITGSFIYTGIDHDMEECFEYRVEGTLEDYTVDVWWVESN